MSEIPFNRTETGRKFYEYFIPMLVKNLGRIADSLEKIVSNTEKEKKEAKNPKKEV
jgi:hypothetical protein